jgi:hypothetical protein
MVGNREAVRSEGGVGAPLILRSDPKDRVSKDGHAHRIRGHPSRRPRSLSSGRAVRGPVGGLLRMRGAGGGGLDRVPNAENQSALTFQNRATRSRGRLGFALPNDSLTSRRAALKSKAPSVVDLSRPACSHVKQLAKGPGCIEPGAGALAPPGFSFPARLPPGARGRVTSRCRSRYLTIFPPAQRSPPKA